MLATLIPTILQPHLILFNIASTTVLGLTPEQRQEVLDDIDCTMNGDGLYEGADPEVILEAYFDQHSTGHGNTDTWVDLIKDILHARSESN